MKQLLVIEPSLQNEIRSGLDEKVIQRVKEKMKEIKLWEEEEFKVEVTDNRRLVKEGEVLESQMMEMKIQ
jgi:hypothetical protein